VSKTGIRRPLSNVSHRFIKQALSACEQTYGESLMANPAFVSLALVGAMVGAVIALPSSAPASVTAPRAAIDAPRAGHREGAVFAGGCFWGVEGVYSHVKGVLSATSGYTGGSAANATYDQASTGRG
jgi:hypothetical protein